MLKNFAIVLLVFSGSMHSASALTFGICTKTADVLDASGNYQKSICLVPNLLTQNNARLLCARRGMSLYDPTSSTLALTKLKQFIKVAFNGKAANSALIARKGTICQIINGAGIVKAVNCGNKFKSVCEYKRATLPTPGVCGVNTVSRIVGGTESGLREFPWLVKLLLGDKKGDYYECGGSLINTRYVMTAAHCVYDNIIEAVVTLDEWDTSTGVDCNGTDCNVVGYDVIAEDIIINENYNPTTQYNDIALLRLKRDVVYTEFVRPLCLPIDAALQKMNYAGVALTAAGWGNTKQDGDGSNVLLKVDLNGVSNQQCNVVYKDIISSQLCAGGVEGFDTCQGDSGGPLMDQNTDAVPNYYYAAGVVSYGEGCAHAGVPGIYTRVSSFLTWIQGNMRA